MNDRPAWCHYVTADIQGTELAAWSHPHWEAWQKSDYCFCSVYIFLLFKQVFSLSFLLLSSVCLLSISPSLTKQQTARCLSDETVRVSACVHQTIKIKKNSESKLLQSLKQQVQSDTGESGTREWELAVFGVGQHSTACTEDINSQVR